MSKSVFVQVLDGLNRSGARYVAVGGLATVLHGVQRFTADLDIIVDFADRNCALVTDALVGLGFAPNVPVNVSELCNSQERTRWIEEKNATVLSLRNPLHPSFAVDIFLNSPIDFETLYRDSKYLMLTQVAVRVCSVAHLIELKAIAGRPKDLDDIANLKKILEKRESDKR